MMNRVFRIILLLMLVSSCKDEVELLSVEPLIEFESIDTNRLADKKFRKSKNDIYLLNAFTKHRMMMFFTDSIVNLTKDISRYENYSISFYKPSDKTSKENLEKNPKDFHNYSKPKDLVLVYKWHNGKYLGVEMISSGKVLDPNIKISIKNLYKPN